MNLRNLGQVTLVVASLLTNLGFGQEKQPPRDDFRPRRLLPEQPPITRFQTKTVEEVGRTLDPRELVIGVVVGDEARAYPINMLTGPQREIINDELGDRPIAATW